MIRNIVTTAVIAVGFAGAASAEVYVDGFADSRSVVYRGTQPTQVGGGHAYIEGGSDGPQVVNPQATGGQRGSVAVITGGGTGLEVRYERAEAPRAPRPPRS